MVFRLPGHVLFWYVLFVFCVRNGSCQNGFSAKFNQRWSYVHVFWAVDIAVFFDDIRVIQKHIKHMTNFCPHRLPSSLKFNNSPLKNDVWKTILSWWRMPCFAGFGECSPADPGVYSDETVAFHLSNEMTPGCSFRVNRGVYYLVLWGLSKTITRIPKRQSV